MTSSPLGSESSMVHRLRRRPLGRYRYVRLRWRVVMAVIDWLGTALFAAARELRRMVGHATCATADRPDPATILLVQMDHLGDAILSTAMLPSLRRQYPGAWICVLASPWNREVFESCPEVDRVVVSGVNRFARGGWRRLAWIPATFWWGLRLRRQEIDLGIDVRGELPVALLLWLAGARRRIGWVCGGGGFLLTESADFLAHRPEVDSRMALLATLGIRPSADVPPHPSFRPTAATRRGMGKGLAKLTEGHPTAGPLVVLHVGAGTEAKCWPAEHWQQLLGRIILDHGAQVVLVGGPADRIIADRVLGGLAWPGVADWTGRLDLAELAALIERADVFVGADSGPAHLAAAVDTPVVVLFSGTNNREQWQPVGRRVCVVRREVGCSPCHRSKCPRRGHPCMRLLRPAQVAAEVTRILRPASAEQPDHRTPHRQGAPT